MGRYDDDMMSNNARQRDLVLATNEYAFVMSKTNGSIKTYTGPIMLTISQQESLMVFNSKTKQFEETTDFNKAKQLFVSAPENWYVTLKNPAKDNLHPEAGKAMGSPELRIGCKINISGPCSFSLFPGQMAKVIRGHALRSNEYLLARVYEAESANGTDGEVINANGEKVSGKTNYINGQILVIKGTEVSFYIPPTGVEVIPVNNDPRNGYVRNAITLERLEYCILKDENGNKRYVHGPAVVFPKPTEDFVASPNGNYTFRAIELSPISGIYVKVIAEYDDTDAEGKILAHHNIGDEMFITGNDQMIYYPRPEHAVISYDGKITHHAIAIPEGEGRYIMERLTGKIKTIHGPQMYLPDPRTEVVIKRKLSERQCDLWYPGNSEVKAYNAALNEKAVERSAKKISSDELAFKTAIGNVATMANLELNANISRNTSYTKPRTITLDTKFDGAVAIDVWTGYAVNVISKSGKRQVVCGPQTILLDYDQTLEVLELSTGKPKNTDHLEKTVYLRHENNKVSDTIYVVTKDFVDVAIKVVYNVSFDPAAKDKWFSIENYVKHLCDHERSLMKREMKKYTIEELFQNYSDIVRNIAVNVGATPEDGQPAGRYFKENGMYVYDCEVLDITAEHEVKELMEMHQRQMVELSLRLSNATKRADVTAQIIDAETRERELEAQAARAKIALDYDTSIKKMNCQSEVARLKEAEEQAQVQAAIDLQELKIAVHDAELDCKRKDAELKDEIDQKAAELEKAKQESYAKTVEKIMASISPDLIAALQSESSSETLRQVTESMAPWAIATGQSVPDVVNKLLRGTALEDVLRNLKKQQA